MAAAMGKSKPDPDLRKDPGAKFTTTLSGGIWKPQKRIAARTRSRASWIEASGIPTIENAGMPLVMATSTETGRARTPTIVALCTVHLPLTRTACSRLRARCDGSARRRGAPRSR